ncbi:hypothetical protein AB0I53_23625 [Saccharopolyspora sp. NPDC050389]|uniref:hypothetical protein n=1 Tax=Saccharopolyspora sp. NPDC050389 TaxID=3155516 RepID=UPI0033F4A308
MTNSPQRVKVDLQFTLSESTGDGNCYLPETELIAEAVKIFAVDTGLVIECLAELVAEEGVVREEIPTDDDEAPTVAIYLRRRPKRTPSAREPWAPSAAKSSTDS